MLASTIPMRGRIRRVMGLIALAISFGGCAGVTFYSDADLKHRTGIKYYIAKPYLLVTRNAAKDTPLKVDVVQLPDVENPNYAVYKPGWGTHEFALKVSNGILTDYNQKADSKGPETIGAIADLAAKAGSGFGSVATGIANLQKQAADVPAAIGAINQAVGNLNSASSALPTGSKEAKNTKAAADELKDVASDIAAGKTAQKGRLEEIKVSISAITIDSAVPDAPKIRELLATAQTQIDKAVVALASGGSTPTEPPAPSYELYEIRMENGETHLAPVKITKSLLKVIQQYGRGHGD